MLLWNWLIVPLYMKMGEMSVLEIREHVKTNMLIPFFLPFNLIKGGVNAALAVAIYKPVKLVFARVGADDPIRPQK
jgi:riboflavin transporter FmnP